VIWEIYAKKGYEARKCEKGAGEKDNHARSFQSVGDQILRLIDELRALLAKVTYTGADTGKSSSHASRCARHTPGCSGNEVRQ
jgi:hypothetical protein